MIAAPLPLCVLVAVAVALEAHNLIARKASLRGAPKRVLKRVFLQLVVVS